MHIVCGCTNAKHKHDRNPCENPKDASGKCTICQQMDDLEQRLAQGGSARHGSSGEETT
jgi:hypothetical protein